MTPTKEVLELRGEVGALWNAMRGPVKQALRGLDPEAAWAIGGGTILAARWGHRKSWDIDLQVRSRNSLKHLEGDGFGNLRSAIAAKGGRQATSAGGALQRISFGEPPALQRIDIWIHEPEIKAGQTTAVVNGEPETVLSNAQILRGKLERSAKSLGRDIYDIVAAERFDPRSLSIAANAADERAVLSATAEWRKSFGRIGNDIRTGVSDMRADMRGDVYAFAGRACDALIDACYKRMEIRSTPAGVEVETETYGGQRRVERAPLDDAPRMLEAVGVSARVRDKLTTAAAIVAAARAAVPGVTVYREIEGEADTGLDGMTRVFETRTETEPTAQAARPPPLGAEEPRGTGSAARTPGGGWKR